MGSGVQNSYIEVFYALMLLQYNFLICILIGYSKLDREMRVNWSNASQCGKSGDIENLHDVNVDQLERFVLFNCLQLMTIWCFMWAARCCSCCKWKDSLGNFPMRTLMTTLAVSWMCVDCFPLRISVKSWPDSIFFPIL